MKLYVTLLLLFILTSCSNKEEFFEISGKINGLGNGKVYLLCTGDSIEKTDTIATATIINDTFYLKGDVDYPLLAKIAFAEVDKKYSSIPIVLDNSTFYLRGDYVGSFKRELLGGEWHEKVINQFEYHDGFARPATIARGLYTEYNNLLRIRENDSTKIAMEDIKKKGSEYFGYWSRANKTKYQLITKEAKSTDDPLYKAMLILHYWPKVKVSDSEIMATVEALGKNHYYSKQLIQKVDAKNIIAEAEKSTEIGKTFKNFEVFDVLKENVKSVDAIENNEYTLIEFWASWCGPCRKEIPHLKKVYNEFHKKGFEIFAVSIDKDRGKWIKASKEEEVPWIDTWTGENTEQVKTLFGITAIPFNLLVDHNGIIIAKNLRGENLTKKLEAMLK